MTTHREECENCSKKEKKNEFFRKCGGCGGWWCEKCAKLELKWNGCKCHDPCIRGHFDLCEDCRNEYGYEYDENCGHIGYDE